MKRDKTTCASSGYKKENGGLRLPRSRNTPRRGEGHKEAGGGRGQALFRNIQALRAVAALLVVILHYNKVLLTLANHGIGQAPALLTIGHLNMFGAVGVSIFFVISGFVMGLQRFDQGSGATWQFTARRIARVVPIYWLTTLVLVTFNPVYDAKQLVLSFLFLAGQPVLGPGWTLEYEMFFYLSFAGIVVSGLFGGRKTATVVLIGVFAALALSGAASPRILEFCAGLIAAHTYHRVGGLGPLALGIGMAVLAASAISLTQDWQVITVMWSVGSFLIVLGLAALEHNGFQFMRSQPFQMLGAASYAIYLVHMPLILLGNKYPLWVWQWHLLVDPHIALIAMTAFAAVAGILVHYLVEKPIIRLALSVLLPRRASKRQQFGDVPTSSKERPVFTPS